MDTSNRPATLVRSLRYADLRGRIVNPARLLAWALASAIVILSIVPPLLRPETPLPHDLEHFGIFWAAGFTFALGYTCRDAVLPSMLVIFAGTVEIAQLFVPGRHARLSDFIVDALAISAGLASVLMMDWICARLVTSAT